ncbi:MAG: acetyl-CoA carboxylase biotin carboxyl carrier protein [Planctomycetaceae bacterium]|nr:acetyl-CoA carboxylase biotin carboxyl carrier protein [Planctomycetaceae bacterium]
MSNETFDLKRVKQLVELMRANDLSDIEIKHGESHIMLRRGVHSVVLPSAPASTPPPAAPVSVPSVAKTPEEPSDTQMIRSPMVGTFYAASSPDTPPFAKVGDTVTPEKTVCLIEAMKVYNEIQAECTGKIVEVLVKNGATVEYGSPLFRVSIG